MTAYEIIKWHGKTLYIDPKTGKVKKETLSSKLAKASQKKK